MASKELSAEQERVLIELAHADMHLDASDLKTKGAVLYGLWRRGLIDRWDRRRRGRLQYTDYWITADGRRVAAQLETQREERGES